MIITFLILNWSINFKTSKNTVPNISHEKILHLKTKLLSTCKRYNRIKVPFKHKHVTKQLAENNVILLGQDKVKVVVMMGKSKYTNTLLNLSLFSKLSLWYAKKNKMPAHGAVEDLPSCPTVSNIRTASNHLANYLTKILPLLGKSKYAINSTTDFSKIIRNLKISNQHKVI